MNALPVVLAHGALGPFDEIIFLGVGVVFFVLMGMSWLRSRDLEPEAAADLPDAAPTETHVPAESASVRDADPRDRFTLE